MKRIFITILLLGMVFLGRAAADEEKTVFDEKLVELCNQVVMDIFHDIMAVKSKYKELAGFDESALSKNQYGIYQIVYQFGQTHKKKYSQVTPYQFGFTVDKIKDETFPEQEGLFNFSFPLLGIKLTGYQKKHLFRTQLDTLPFIQDRGALLADYQQTKMPLRLSVEPTKETFNVREHITLKVTLTNVTERHMAIRDPNKDTLYFVIENEVWGAAKYEKENKPKTAQEKAFARAMIQQRKLAGNPIGNVREQRSRVEGKRILRAGESITVIYEGESFLTPKEMDVYCAYRMSFEGVFPTGTTTIKIVDSQLPAASSPPDASGQSKTVENPAVPADSSQ